MKNMKKSMLVLSLTMLLFVTSCDEGFDVMNTNPNAYTEPVLNDMFAYAVNRATLSGTDGDSVDFRWAGGMMQYFSSLWTLRWFGDKYIEDTMNFWGRLYDQGYADYIKEIEQLITLTKDNPDQSNLYNMTRILRVLAYHRITDVYGDIPYFEAGKGFIDGIHKPRFDPQSEIYADLLNELEEATAALDASKPSFGASDYLYSGDVEKWRKFGYSLMLRLGMRLTKVNIDMAEEYVKKAIDGGVFESNADGAMVEHTSQDNRLNHNATNAFIWRHSMQPHAEGVTVAKLGERFVDDLKKFNDPRLRVYATTWEGNSDPAMLPQSSDPSIQKGLPNGYDEVTIRERIPNWDNQMLKEYSELNRWTIGSVEAPTVFQSYSEVELLLAEAAIRNWTSTDAKTHFDNGVAADMKMIEETLPGGMSITQAEIDTYLADNPFPTGGSFEDQMERIHYEMRVTLFMNNIEAWSNWRRTGYPELVPTNYPGNLTGGTIPRRLWYPDSEAAHNTENYNAALQRQGPDLLTTRVWWDVED